jgi:tetratricopeptide (TPR) repeat protein
MMPEDTHVLFINMEDGEDDPQVKIEPYGYGKEYVLPENTVFFYEDRALTELEDLKFKIWNRVLELSTDPVLRKKYLPLARTQATYCISKIPDRKDWADLFTTYHSHIAWYTYLEEEDPEKLTQALLTMENGFELGDYYSGMYYDNTRSLLLLKLGRAEEAYPYVRKMFDYAPDYKPFLHLKTDTHYLNWLQEEERKEKEVKEEWKKKDQAFQLFVKEEQEKVINQFDNPEHPLVIQHAAILDVIKQCMVRIKYRTFNYRSAYKTDNPEPFKNAFVLNKCSILQLEQFEIKHGLHLPDEVKVYLMEIGEGGLGYFRYDGVRLFKLAGELQLKEPVIQEPCLYLGRSWSEDQLYVISKGAHEGEVWVHTQEEGGSRDRFEAASPQQFTFLSFIAESLLTNDQRHNAYPYKGAWM